MMKKFICLTSAVLFSLFILGITCQAADKGPAEMVLKSTVDPAKKAKLAFFPHATHQETFDCATCHHSKDDAGKQVAYTEGQKIEKCDVCHNTKAAGMDKKLNTFKGAAHARCKTCHKALKKEGKDAGPTKCGGCHKKDLK
jgi:hypothetical protein